MTIDVSQGLILGPIVLNISDNLEVDLAKWERTMDRTGLPFRGAVTDRGSGLKETS